MSDFTLSANSPLGSVRLNLAGISIRELADRALVSIAVPQGGETALGQALMSTYGLEFPDVGSSTVASATNVHLLGLQRDQVFVLAERSDEDPVSAVVENLGNTAYCTDQSDSWAIVELSGPECRRVLERICPIDLDAERFSEGAVTRTLMEHLGVIILRNGTDSFLLFSAASSARAFLHMLETSVRNAL